MASFIEQELKIDEDPSIDVRFSRKKTWINILQSKIGKGLVCTFSIAIIVPTITYFFVISRNITEDSDDEIYSCLVRQEFRIPCGKPNISETECVNVNCCFNTTTSECHHYLPSKYFYTPQADGTYKSSQLTSPVTSKMLVNLGLSIQKKSDRLSIIWHDTSVIVDEIDMENNTYTIQIAQNKLAFEVFDEYENLVLSTVKAALIASDYYWEWSFQLSEGLLFGLDRNLIRLDSTDTITKVIYKNGVDHSTLPVFWVHVDGKFHGVAIKHDGPMEIQVLPSNIVIIRSLLGKIIEIEVSSGPTPIELFHKQSNNLSIPPDWLLGSHICRQGESIELDEILEIYRQNNQSTFDSDCIHQNLFMALQNSPKSEDVEVLRAHIKNINESGIHFMMSLPPHILSNEDNELYKISKQLDLLYKNQSGLVYNGSYLNSKVVYPDYSNEQISVFIEALLNWVDKFIGLENINGFVLNDNWPIDESYAHVEKTNFPYYSDQIDTQMAKTLPWTLQGSDKTLHLEKHNLYGHYQQVSLHNSLTARKAEMPVIVSSTKIYGDNEFVISENLDPSWENFRSYLNKILFGNISGSRMISLPICGDTSRYNKTLHEKLCVRWYIAAATMPFFRVSSGEEFRDPEHLKTKYAAYIVEAALKRRRLMKDYFLTILHKPEPIVRPMYFDYYHNTSVFSLERQYTVGGDMIVAHPFSEGKTRIQVYLPSEKGVWYEFWGGEMFLSKKYDEYIDIDCFESDWITFVAQGTIVPLTSSHKIQLYIALDCSLNKCKATGQLQKSDNNIIFEATNTSVMITGIPNECNYTVSCRVYGYDGTTGYIRPFGSYLDICHTGNNSVLIPLDA